MTLGRTSDNKIKIKTDGGTTRAVGCACCGGCGCVTISDPVLAAILETATTGSTSGPTVAGDFNFSQGRWVASFFGPQVYIVEYTFASKRFCMNGDNAFNLISAGECECSSGFSCATVNFSINGTIFPSTQFTVFGSPVSPPIFTFS